VPGTCSSHVVALSSDRFASLPLAPSAPLPDRSEDDLVEIYRGAWKKWLASTNDLDVDALDANVRVEKAKLAHARPGTSLVVSYTVTIGWATASLKDSLRVRIDASEPRPPRNLPLDRWLEPADVEALARLEVPLQRLPLGQRLKFASRAAALAALRRSVRIPEGEPLEMVLDGSPPHLHLTWSIGLPHRANRCFLASIDLMTGHVQRNPQPCPFRDF
jgi:hypothetical protein